MVIAGRLQRWALCLTRYQYDIVYKPTQKHENADGLLRYLSTESEVWEEEGSDCIVAIYELQPLTVKDIERETLCDELLRKVLTLTKDGWKDMKGRPDDQLRP